MKSIISRKTEPAVSSGKPRLLYVDHIFHIKTRSTTFLADILSAHFDVHVIYVDPDARVDMTKFDDPAEYVVIFQMDFLTPAFVAAGKRVTVVQMYDGSAGLPSEYYTLNRQARHLNFSSALHARALSLGVQSHLAHYFPDPANSTPVEDFSTLRGFFWQRLPNSSINVGKIRTMLGADLDSLHIHTPSDDGTPFDEGVLEGFPCEVTTSEWFEKQSGFSEQMDKCNVFIAPRYAEGIGHAFLEAMARGMLVLAYDLPTHNEYISNWFTGVLFSDQVDVIHLRDRNDQIRKMSQNARLTIEEGHKRWLKSHQGIIDFVKDATPAQVPPVALESFVNGTMEAYQQGIGSYTRYLQSHPELCNALGNWNRIAAELEEAADADATRGVAKTALFFFGYNGAHMILGQGWSTSEPSHVWALKRRATLKIPLGGSVPVKTLTFQVRGLGAYDLSVEINGVDVGTISLKPSLDSFTLTLPKSVLEKDANVLSIVLTLDDGIEIPRVESRPLTFLIKTLELSI
jgi:hypothetical protein